MTQQRDWEPIQSKYRERLNSIARALDNFLNPERVKGEPRELGFVLLVFPFGDVDKRRCNYISNGASRSDIVSLFKEMITRFEAPGGGA